MLKDFRKKVLKNRLFYRVFKYFFKGGLSRAYEELKHLPHLLKFIIESVYRVPMRN